MWDAGGSGVTPIPLCGNEKTQNPAVPSLALSCYEQAVWVLRVMINALQGVALGSVG